jgi:hypothetical protein
MRVGYRKESRLSSPQSRPSVAARIDRADDDDRKKRIELAVLIEQKRAHEPLAYLIHPLGDADAPLNLQFAFMPGRRLVRLGDSQHFVLPFHE